MTKVFSPLELPNGQILPNRLGKAAMEENLANHGQVPGEALANLYGRWARGGAGLILTGNVMVSPDAMTGTGGVFLGKNTLFEGDHRMRFTRWANAGKSATPVGKCLQVLEQCLFLRQRRGSRWRVPVRRCSQQHAR